MSATADEIAVIQFFESITRSEVEHLSEVVSQIEGSTEEYIIVILPIIGSDDFFFFYTCFEVCEFWDSLSD